MKRRPIDIKKEIFSILEKENTISVKKLERKINTGYKTILNNCEELGYLGFLVVEKTLEGSSNGRHYLVIKLIALP